MAQRVGNLFPSICSWQCEFTQVVRSQCEDSLKSCALVYQQGQMNESNWKTSSVCEEEIT